MHGGGGVPGCLAGGAAGCPVGVVVVSAWVGRVGVKGIVLFFTNSIPQGTRHNSQHDIQS